jgi:hypothetical protein
MNNILKYIIFNYLNKKGKCDVEYNFNIGLLRKKKLLKWCIKNNCHEFLDLLLFRKEMLNNITLYSIYVAIIRGNYKVLKLMLEKYNLKDLICRNYFVRTCVIHDRGMILEEILKNNNYKKKYQMLNWLRIAVRRNHIEIIKILLRFLPEKVFLGLDEIISEIFIMCTNNEILDILKNKFINYKGDSFYMDFYFKKSGENPWKILEWKNNKFIRGILNVDKENINKNWESNNFFKMMFIDGNIEIVGEFLDNNLLDNIDYYLSLSCALYYPKMFKLLLKYKNNIKNVDPLKYNPELSEIEKMKGLNFLYVLGHIYEPLKKEHIKTIKMIYKYTKVKSEKHALFLIISAKYGLNKLVKFLLSKNENGSKKAFIKGCSNGHLNVVKLISKIKDFDIYYKYHKGFISAFNNNHFDICEYLFNYYKEIKISDEKRIDDIERMLINGDIETLNKLLNPDHKLKKSDVINNNLLKLIGILKYYKNNKDILKYKNFINIIKKFMKKIMYEIILYTSIDSLERC